ncbi:MAG: tetratricopeptide repeat protein [Dokdonella sp.]|uniref:O-linked N-acetylglucosamine transferase, SPINDLY family protein n=1 Tax=Dokdonella sp. TaxID=2291710 RepID=UPI0025BF1FE6|nr:tetratricopeptide repeat protein [Dokdonella sp.]MBZ0224225.1 tetratricopeptide repeat protein [Dokdonella sp.]
MNVHANAAPTQALHEIATHLDRGRPDFAASAARSACARWPDEAQVHRLLGIALLQQGQIAEALSALERARQLQPASIEILANLANAQASSGALDGARTTLDAALRLAPAHPSLHNQLGNVLHATGDLPGACAAWRAATRAQADHVGAWCNLAAGEFALGDSEAADRDLSRALALAPDYAPAFLLLGQIRAARGDATGAEQAWLRGADLAPRDARFAYQLGLLAEEDRQIARAAQLQAHAFALDPSLHQALGQLAFLRRQLCDWRELDALSQGLRARIAAGVPGIAPFGFLAEPASAAEQLRCARIAATGIEAQMAPLRSRIHAPARERASTTLRIGLISNGFGNHPTGLLCVALIEALREHALETHLFATSTDDGSTIRARLSAAAHMHAVANLDPLALAQAIAQQDLDLLIDLRGYGGGSVAQTLALRPAPLQVAWFAYPGTSGAPWIDYLIADRHVLPPSLRAHFSEAIAWLPRCFQPSDPTREVGMPPSRQACGLPGDGMVYVCFNNSYKINPQTFARLLAPLRAVAGSALWLLSSREGVDQRLRDAARAHGIDPARLIFQPKLPHAQYLALYRHADLFLDTTPYGAHTTASDAIWAGCPVLTVPGETFAARVAASLNGHLGMPQLNVRDDAAFIAEAIALGKDAPPRAALRAQLSQRRADSGLFDMSALARDLVTLLQQMVERQRAGLAPTDLG